MNSKMMASRQYASNQMGGPLPKLGQKIKQIFKGKGGSKDHPGAVTMECSKDGCGSMNAGGGKSNVGRETNRQNKGGAKGLSTRKQYSKNVIKPGSFKAKRHQRKMDKARSNETVTREQALFKMDRSKF
jgi:hypothetical protein